ncbi:hypothetical protein GCM10019059_37430 [Camelimonas fluminis]|nr:hypothetical protein GCM10019059_37430 [Camelimonas fluminis]
MHAASLNQFVGRENSRIPIITGTSPDARITDTRIVFLRCVAVDDQSVEAPTLASQTVMEIPVRMTKVRTGPQAAESLAGLFRFAHTKTLGSEPMRPLAEPD